MSAWYLFSALGFYPLVTGSREYAVGSPLFTKATVHLENGRELVVKAPQNSAQNVYVQGLKVNGKPWTVHFAAAQADRPRRHPGVRHGAQALPVGHGQERTPRPRSPRTTRCPRRPAM